MGGRGGPALTKGGTSAAPAASAFLAPGANRAIESEITQAYLQLRGERNDIVRLTDIRPMLSERFTKAEVDGTLRLMNTVKGINIIPQSNQKILSERDRQSMVRIGNEDRLLLSINLP